MDEDHARLIPQSSICSDFNGEEYAPSGCSQLPSSDDRQICFVGDVAKDATLRSVAETFGCPIVTSPDGKDYIRNDLSTIFIVEPFDTDIYNVLCKAKQPILGPIALKQLAEKKEELPQNTRPLYNLAMSGVVVCFTGFRNKAELATLVSLIHHMGGSIRKEMSSKVTHLIANSCGGEKYLYAATFRVPVMHSKWVLASWEKREDLTFKATLDVFIAEFKLKPFHGAKVCFHGFAEEEEKHMTEVLLSNGGTVTTKDDPHCTHVVMEHADVYTLEAASAPLSPPQVPEPQAQSDLNYQNFLETLHEKSRESLDLSQNLTQRKRKISPSECVEQQEQKSKKKRDKSFSEKKTKLSAIFKTPVSYFSQRRRTIDSTAFNQTLNESAVSSSGIFNVETVTNLNETTTTPKKRKSLFTRTFSSSKFTRNKTKKKLDLNATRLSFGPDCSFDANDSRLSYFPNCSLNCSLNPNPNTHRSDSIKESRGTSVAVVDEGTVAEKPEASIRTWIVKAEWFWTSVQKEISLDEKEYLYDDYLDQVISPARRESHQATPTSASRRKRKRLHDTLLSLATHQQSPSLHKRRSSVSDAGLLSVSGSFLDCTPSPDKVLVDSVEPVVETPRKALTARQQVFLELVQTETNYVNILHTIMVIFKQHLENMSGQEALLNNTELNFIFGKLPPIYETHVKMLNDLTHLSQYWSEECSIGNIIMKYSTGLLKAYPPYINFFEEMKEVLTQCDQNKPRFHAFLKACQTKVECGRQSLQELMIRPVQRLGSICLLLNDILKNTPKTNPDHAAVEQALAALREVMTHINEDKRKAEGQVTLFNIFNDIDNCPPDIVSSHRSFISKTEVIQLSSSEGLSSRGNNLMLFLFSDQLEVCKKKSKSFNSARSPGTGVSSLQRPITKPYKHVRLLSLNAIKRVIDIKETEECQKVFSLVCRHTDDVKERLYSFAMADEEADKGAFLKTLTRQMANNACTADADKFLAHLEPHQLDIDTSDVNNGKFSKAFKFAYRTRLKVERAFSFNKTPSKLKRAVSSMMSPFGSSTNITPASQLAQMRLASYNNISELGNADNASETQSQPVAPMSVQPTRKLKSASLNENALKRL